MVMTGSAVLLTAGDETDGVRGVAAADGVEPELLGPGSVSADNNVEALDDCLGEGVVRTSGLRDGKSGDRDVRVQLSKVLHASRGASDTSSTNVLRLQVEVGTDISDRDGGRVEDRDALRARENQVLGCKTRREEKLKSEEK
jgi:hypothetical protein